MALLALVQNLITGLTGFVTIIATLPWIGLLALSVSIDLISPSARDTSVKFQKGLGLSELETTGPIDRTPGTPGSDKNAITRGPKYNYEESWAFGLASGGSAHRQLVFHPQAYRA